MVLLRARQVTLSEVDKPEVAKRRRLARRFILYRQRLPVMLGGLLQIAEGPVQVAEHAHRRRLALDPTAGAGQRERLLERFDRLGVAALRPVRGAQPAQRRRLPLRLLALPRRLQSGLGDGPPLVGGQVGTYQPQTLLSLKTVSTGMEEARILLGTELNGGEYRLEVRNKVRSEMPAPLTVFLGPPN